MSTERPSRIAALGRPQGIRAQVKNAVPADASGRSKVPIVAKKSRKACSHGSCPEKVCERYNPIRCTHAGCPEIGCIVPWVHVLEFVPKPKTSGKTPTPAVPTMNWLMRSVRQPQAKRPKIREFRLGFRDLAADLRIPRTALPIFVEYWTGYSENWSLPDPCNDSIAKKAALDGVLELAGVAESDRGTWVRGGLGWPPRKTEGPLFTLKLTAYDADFDLKVPLHAREDTIRPNDRKLLAHLADTPE